MFQKKYITLFPILVFSPVLTPRVYIYNTTMITTTRV